ncbi:hypothetical protein F5Y03DRAFT_338357 [Xylaria venustula]|nr:hypothetical protein F5Y03DRAFT_338357 [Xylaria venustula]
MMHPICSTHCDLSLPDEQGFLFSGLPIICLLALLYNTIRKGFGSNPRQPSYLLSFFLPSGVVQCLVSIVIGSLIYLPLLPRSSHLPLVVFRRSYNPPLLLLPVARGKRLLFFNFYPFSYDLLIPVCSNACITLHGSYHIFQLVNAATLSFGRNGAGHDSAPCRRRRGARRKFLLNACKNGNEHRVHNPAIEPQLY